MENKIQVLFTLKLQMFMMKRTLSLNRFMDLTQMMMKIMKAKMMN